VRVEYKTHEHEFRNLGTGRATTLRGMRFARLGICDSGPLYLSTVRALEAAGSGAGIASTQGLARDALRDAAMEHFTRCPSLPSC
jgi:hypothetical protein